MRLDMAFDDLSHESVDRSAASGDRLKDIIAVFFLSQVSIDRLNLPANAADPIEKSRLVLDGMCHIRRIAYWGIVFTCMNQFYLPYSRPMRRLAAALLLCVLVFDVAVDSFDATCRDSTASQPCHVCVCQTHAVNPNVSSVVKVPLSPPQRVPPSAPMIKQRLSDKELFHPPQPLA